MKMKLTSLNGTLEVDILKKSEGLVFIRLHPEETPRIVDRGQPLDAHLRSLLRGAGLRTDGATYSYIDGVGVVRSGPLSALVIERGDWR